MTYTPKGGMENIFVQFICVNVLSLKMGFYV